MKKITLTLTLSFIACTPKYKSYNYTPVLEGHSRGEYEAFGKKYMISTQGAGATAAAKYVLDRGGNIFDAASAASFAISVERPHSTGLGGGGFMLINHARTKKVEAIDFREMAPRMASSNIFLDKKGRQVKERSLTGALAVGTPGLVAGIVSTQLKYGKLPLHVVMQPAIKLARDGILVYPALSKAMNSKKDKLCQFPASASIFLKNNCEAYKAGEILYQKDLAKTLERISKNGHDGFYKGFTANQIVKYQKKSGGLIGHSDLKYYKVKNRDPIVGTYKGYKVISMPPPSSGGTHIIQILNILEGYDLKSMGAQSAEAIHLTSSAMQIAFADRAEYMGDSDFAVVPVKNLIDKKYAKKLRKKIKIDKALKSNDFPIPLRKLLYESDDTTHFTIMDSEGNIVSSTQTINGWFGSSMVTPKTGVVMNNEMDDFASHVGGVNLFGAVGGKNNLVEARKRPLSSMSPSIVFDKKNQPMLALGTPSGTRILTCVMQTILNVIEYDMPLWEAVGATRYHHQWSPEEIRIGSPGFSKDVESQLVEMGHKINHKDLGCKIQAILKKGNNLHGVSDMREEGSSFGM